MRRCNNPFLSNLVIPDSFAQCMSYAQRQNWLYKKMCELEDRVAALEKKVNPNSEVDETKE